MGNPDQGAVSHEIEAEISFVASPGEVSSQSKQIEVNSSASQDNSKSFLTQSRQIQVKS